MLIGTQTLWHLTAHGAQTRDDVIAECERVMENLLELEREEGHISSPAVSVDLGTMVVTIDLAAEASHFDDAEKFVADAIHRAVEQSGGAMANRGEVVGKHAELIPA